MVLRQTIGITRWLGPFFSRPNGIDEPLLQRLSASLWYRCGILRTWVAEDNFEDENILVSLDMLWLGVLDSSTVLN